MATMHFVRDYHCAPGSCCSGHATSQRLRGELLKRGENNARRIETVLCMVTVAVKDLAKLFGGVCAYDLRRLGQAPRRRLVLQSVDEAFDHREALGVQSLPIVNNYDKRGFSFQAKSNEHVGEGSLYVGLASPWRIIQQETSQVALLDGP